MPGSTSFWLREAVPWSPFGQLDRLATFDVGTSTLLHARLVAAPNGTGNFPNTSNAALPRLARSTITVLNPWSFRQHSVPGRTAHAFSSLVASRSQAVIHRLHRRGPGRMNALPRSAFRLSLLREPTAHAGANRFNVRATSRTQSLSGDKRRRGESRFARLAWFPYAACASDFRSFRIFFQKTLKTLSWPTMCPTSSRVDGAGFRFGNGSFRTGLDRKRNSPEL